MKTRYMRAGVQADDLGLGQPRTRRHRAEIGPEIRRRSTPAREWSAGALPPRRSMPFELLQRPVFERQRG